MHSYAYLNINSRSKCAKVTRLFIKNVESLVWKCHCVQMIKWLHAFINQHTTNVTKYISYCYLAYTARSRQCFGLGLHSDRPDSSSDSKNDNWVIIPLWRCWSDCHCGLWKWMLVSLHKTICFSCNSIFISHITYLLSKDYKTCNYCSVAWCYRW